MNFWRFWADSLTLCLMNLLIFYVFDRIDPEWFDRLAASPAPMRLYYAIHPFLMANVFCRFWHHKGQWLLAMVVYCTVSYCYALCVKHWPTLMEID